MTDEHLENQLKLKISTLETKYFYAGSTKVILEKPSND